MAKIHYELYRFMRRWRTTEHEKSLDPKPFISAQLRSFHSRTNQALTFLRRSMIPQVEQVELGISDLSDPIFAPLQEDSCVAVKRAMSCPLQNPPQQVCRLRDVD